MGENMNKKYNLREIVNFDNFPFSIRMFLTTIYIKKQEYSRDELLIEVNTTSDLTTTMKKSLILYVNAWFDYPFDDKEVFFK